MDSVSSGPDVRHPSDLTIKIIPKQVTWVAILFLGLMIPCVSLAGPEKPPEYLVKATFLYNFANFVEWPADAFESPDGPVIVCIFGQDPFGDVLVTIADKKAANRPIVIRFCDNLEEIENCHILFVSSSEKSNLSNVLSKIRGKACLTVSDMDGFVRNGGMVGFFILENKVRFEINLSAVKPSGLEISSKLLKLARITGQDKTIEKDIP